MYLNTLFLTVICIVSAGELREIVVESPAAVVVAVSVARRGVPADGGQWKKRKGVDSSGTSRTQTGPNTGRTLPDVTLFRSLFCTPACIFPSCFVLNCTQSGMAGLGTSAGISSFITWSTCSGHRSLNSLRTFATYTGARKNNPPNRRLLGRTATVTSPSTIPRVRFLISRVSSSWLR